MVFPIDGKDVSLRPLTLGEISSEWPAWVSQEPVRRLKSAFDGLASVRDQIGATNYQSLLVEQTRRAIEASVSNDWQPDGVYGLALANSYRGVREFAWLMARDSAKANGITQERFYAAFDENSQALVALMRKVNGVSEGADPTRATADGP